MKLNKLLLTVLAGSFLFVSCNNDDDNSTSAPSGAYDNGVLVLNQGNFGAGNATVSFISDTLTVENNIFATNNTSSILGDTAQDLGFYKDLAYIVLNYSNKIEIVNRYTFKHVAEITEGLDNPRYIVFENGKAYVTNWGDGGVATDDYVAVVNLSTNQVTASIPVAEGPERIVSENNKLYVTHYGGYSIGNSVTVINTNNDAVVTTIVTGDAPKFITEEDNKIYVLSEGRPSYAGTETFGKLHTIDARTNKITNTIDFPEGAHPSNLTIEDDKMYYTIDNNIYVTSLNAKTLPTQPLFSVDEQGVYGIYAFEVEDNHIYIGDAENYTQNGKVYIYSTSGTLENTFTVGLLPTGFYFNN